MIHEHDSNLNPGSDSRSEGKVGPGKCFYNGYIQWETPTVGLETQSWESLACRW